MKWLIVGSFIAISGIASSTASAQKWDNPKWTIEHCYKRRGNETGAIRVCSDLQMKHNAKFGNGAPDSNPQRKRN
jgi:hypothetical protein